MKLRQTECCQDLFFNFTLIPTYSFHRFSYIYIRTIRLQQRFSKKHIYWIMTEKETVVDPQLEHFILAETQKQRFQVLVHGLTDTCWDTCMVRPASRMDSKTEVCIMNCVERFIDATTFITRRLMNTTKYRAETPLQFQ